MTKQNKRKQLDDLYAQLPVLECKQRCFASCGLIAGSKEERRLMEKKGRRAAGVTDDGECNYLERGKCTVYAVRPMLCRLYGLTHKLKCPHGCTPSRWLTEEEAYAFMAKCERIGGFDMEWQRRNIEWLKRKVNDEQRGSDDMADGERDTGGRVVRSHD